MFGFLFAKPELLPQDKYALCTVGQLNLRSKTCKQTIFHSQSVEDKIHKFSPYEIL